jgi:hypothetical protein
MKTKTVLLGSLGLAEHFVYQGIKYRVITYPVSNHNPLTKRYCLNLTTFQAEYIFCNIEIEVPCGTI